MYFIMYIIVLFLVYIATFKDDFKPENLEKAGPFLAIIVVLLILSMLFSSASAM